MLRLARHYSTEQNKEDKVGGACSMHGGEQRCIQVFLWKKARGNLVDLSVGGNITKWILNKSAAKDWKGFVWSTIGISGGLL